jgi:16S rRNA (adenine1518-N6/adenine1519-N6)-dimethyltransferase
MSKTPPFKPKKQAVANRELVKIHKKSTPKNLVLGQHFLTDRNILNKMVSAADVSPNDIVLEIGAGSGTLTEVLAKQAKRVIAVEKDPKLAELLKAKFSDQKNVKIIPEDILKINPSSFGLHNSGFKIVANIPYYITGRLLRLMFSSWPRPVSATLMLQKEVAERIAAKPPKMNRLAAIVQLFSEPKIIAVVRKGAFKPAPRVDSAIITLKNIRQPEPADLRATALISAGFRHPRKYLITNLAKQFSKEAALQTMKALDLSPKARPAELHPHEWRQLAEIIHTNS